MIFPIARVTQGSSLTNTVNLRTVRLRFQKSPGRRAGQGIADLDFRIRAGGLTRVARTGADGELVVPLGGGVAVVELLQSGSVVTTYVVTVLDEPFDPVVDRVGQQQRLRTLGYQLGHEGPFGDGVQVPEPPINITPPSPRPTDPEEDSDDRAERARTQAIIRKNPQAEEQSYQDLLLASERSILDFQADSNLVVDGLVGPRTQARLTQEAGA